MVPVIENFRGKKKSKMPLEIFRDLHGFFQGDTSVVVLILFYVLVFKIVFVLLAPYVCYHIFS